MHFCFGFLALQLLRKFHATGLQVISFKQVRKCRNLCAEFRENHNFDRQYVEIDLQEAGCVDMDWIELAQYRDSWRVLVNAVMNLRVS